MAALSDRDLPQLEKVFDQSTVLALDHVTDPRNLGAIVRTAAYYGIKYIILPKDRQVLLTPASVGTAQGGFALTNLVVVTNLARFLGVLKSKNYWVIGAALRVSLSGRWILILLKGFWFWVLNQKVYQL